MSKVTQLVQKIAELQEQIKELENSLANDSSWGQAEIIQELAQFPWAKVKQDCGNGWVAVTVEMPSGFQETVWLRYILPEDAKE